MSQTVAEAFLTAVERWPDAPFLIDAETGAERTYAEVRRAAQRWAGLFGAAGLRRGGRVGVVLPNRLEFVELFFGAALRGLALCPYSPAVPAEEVAALLTRFGAGAFVATSVAVADWKSRLSMPVLDLASGATGPEVVAVDAAAEDPLLFIMTSGTTGSSKACRLTQHNLAWAGELAAREFGLGPDSRYLTPLPLFHINPYVVALLPAMAVGSAVALGGRLPGAKLAEAAVRVGATGLSLVPALAADVVSAGAKLPASLRFAVSSSAPLSPELLEKFERFSGTQVRQCYGLSESSGFVAFGSLSPRQPNGSVGPISSGWELRLSAEGEVCVRSAGVFGGYEGDAAATASTIRDGFLHTGDVGRLDEHGNLWLKGRLKEMVNRGGEKVAPLDVEAALRQHPAVAEVAVFAIPDERLGERVAAAVVWRGPEAFDEDALVALAQKTLPETHVPETWVTLDSLPRGPTGKVLRRVLADAHRAPKAKGTT